MNNPIIVTDRVLSYYDSKLKGYIGSFYGCDMIVEWEPMENGKNYFKLKIALKNKHGDELFSKIVDFPLEQTIVSGSYDNDAKSLILYFQDGSSTDIPIEDLIEGLATKLDLEKKADLGENQVVIGNDYSVDIPTKSAPYAQISKIGGMTYKVDNTLRNVKITEVKSVGTNHLPYPYISNGNTHHDVVWKVNTDGTVVANGTANGGNSILNLHNPISLPQGDYYIYANDGNNLPSGCAIVMYKNGSYIGEANDVFSFSVTSNDKLRIYLQIATGVTVNNAIFKPMIAKSITPYVPYTEHILAIPECVQSLEGYGLGINSSLYNFIDFEGKKFNKKVAKAIYNGSEDWAITSVDAEWKAFSVPLSAKTALALNSQFEYNYVYEGGYEHFYIDKNGKIYFFTNRFSTVDEWKTHLNTNPMETVYQLITPTTEDIPEIDNIISVECGGTLIFENEYGYNVPYEIEYTLNSNDVIGAKEFVGNLKGTAEIAKYYDDNGNPSTQTIGEALNKLLGAGNPIKITTESIGQLSTTQVLTGISANILANPPVAINDIILDRYLDGDAAYLCFWLVTNVSGGSTDSTMTLQGAGNIYVGGGNSSIADRAISDGNGKNIAETYETKAQVKAITDEIKSTANSAYERATVAINTAQDSLNRVNRGVYSIDADYTSGAGSIGTFYLRVNFVGGGSESYDITEELRGLINDVLTYDR